MAENWRAVELNLFKIGFGLHGSFYLFSNITSTLIFRIYEIYQSYWLNTVAI